jgi:MFS family permease
MTNSRLSAAPKAHAGAAAGVVNTARMIGATLGVAVLGGIFAAHAGENPVDPERIVAGLHWAFVGGAISEILGALTAWLDPQRCLGSRRVRPVSQPRGIRLIFGWDLLISGCPRQLEKNGRH